MTEERICATCKYVDEETCEYIHQRCLRPEGACMKHSKWQPIQKAQSFQMTEEEARRLFIDLGISESVEIAIEEAMRHGYIRKSELVELVEEAEKIWAIYYSDSEFIPSNINCKLYQALQALKKDHPEFGEKK